MQNIKIIFNFKCSYLSIFLAICLIFFAFVAEVIFYLNSDNLGLELSLVFILGTSPVFLAVARYKNKASICTFGGKRIIDVLLKIFCFCVYYIFFIIIVLLLSLIANSACENLKNGFPLNQLVSENDLGWAINLEILGFGFIKVAVDFLLAIIAARYYSAIPINSIEFGAFN